MNTKNNEYFNMKKKKLNMKPAKMNQKPVFFTRAS